LAHRILATDHEPVVVAGNGGNGGGGLACARHLHNHDVPVAVVLDRDTDALTGAAAQQYRIPDATDVPVTTGVEGLATVDRIGVVADALMGDGLDGPTRDPARSLVEGMNRRDSGVVSLDVPSGIDATTGETLGTAVRPETTITLALPKTELIVIIVSHYRRVAERGGNTPVNSYNTHYENPSGTTCPRRHRDSTGRGRPPRHRVRRPVRPRVVANWRLATGRPLICGFKKEPQSCGRYASNSASEPSRRTSEIDSSPTSPTVIA